MKVWVKKFHENPIVTDFYLDTIAEIFKRKNFEIESIRDWNRYKPKKNDLTLVGTTLDALKPVIKRNKYVLWIQGIWPEECFYNHKKKWEYYLTSVIELIALKNAKFVFFVSKEMKNHYEKKYKLNFEDRYYIMPCNNEEMHLEAFNVANKYRNNLFCYAGSINKWQCVEETLRLYKKIEMINPNAKLLMLVKEKDKAMELIDKYQIENYELDFVPVNKLQERLKDVKFGFIIREDYPFNVVATPTKFATYITNGIIPIVSDCLKGITEMCEDTQYVIKLNKKCDIEDIVDLMNQNLDSNKIKNEYMKIYDEYYDREKNIASMNRKVKYE